MAQFFNTPHVRPVLLDCNFIVASSDAGGLGITSLKGQGIKNVFMHTSSTPLGGNPNPANGVIVVQFTANHFRYYGGFYETVGVAGTPATSVTASTAYVITALGTASTAAWNAVGLPLGLVPTVGQSFVATASGTIGGSATAAPSSTTGSNIDHIEILGNPSLSLNPTGNLSYIGGSILFQCFKAQAVAAPTDGTQINLAFYLSNSSVLVKGE